jgi:threonine aldolase
MKNITIKKLSAMPYAQAHIEIHEDGAVSLFSYVTLVAHITADGWLTVYGLYSATTRKHISAFMREYAHPCDYYTAKAIYNDNKMINIHTGEVEDLD